MKYITERFQPAPPVPHSVWTNPIHFIACGFGTGCLPWFPGTWGTLAGVLLYLIIAPLPLITSIILLCLLCLIGIYICEQTNRDFGTHDHPATCFDEFATFPICLLGIPSHWHLITIAFVLFRVLDILKPPPIGTIDRRVGGGVGVMLDDIVAALMTLAIMHLLILIPILK